DYYCQVCDSTSTYPLF
nr:immunoglobulin light chain junction region [Macaca mulatta]MOX19451.1 immunoglobulin light chain junction region [Macaca mulatta]MOX21099.1 immunoglobulin light chain junction region [Macaca mulatta]MOX22210.1 immunoglobulin light chain junction region [Macaca mulatta]